MSATTVSKTVEVDTPPYTSHYAEKRVNFARMVRSEWLKLWTLRSTWWVSILTIVLMMAMGLLFSAVIQIMLNQADGGASMGAAMDSGNDGFDMTNAGALVLASGYQFAQLTVAVFGVMSISNEYSSGMIRATFSAAPRRLRTLWAKLLVVTATTTVIAVLGLVLAWAATYPILSHNNMTVDFSSGTTIRALVGVVLYLILISWFSLGFGTILRHTAGGISTVMGILLVLPMITGIIMATAPTVSWVGTINKYLPPEAGAQVIMGGLTGDATVSVGGSADGGGVMSMMQTLSPWVGFAVLAAYTVVVVIIAAIRIKKSDA
ncbi:MAG: ABC transporter permease subunit [Cellulomonadaceae bacterium]|jgi:ABC-2 type transport system permease protein|nr:ABC transporter permease subunit [Cellulomonadaceae bacterium]